MKWVDGWMDGWMDGWVDGQWMGKRRHRDDKEFWPGNQGRIHEGLRYVSWILKHLGNWR